MRVGKNGRYLTGDDGRPFFWLADTAWSLFVKPTLEDIALYMDNRRGKGFTVIQCVLTGVEERGCQLADPDGARPFRDDNPATPDDGYFRRVDAVLELAARRGLILAILPAWGDFVIGAKNYPPMVTTANARAYGRWLGKRYRNAANLAWVLGGDRDPDENGDHIPVFDELAAGLAEGDGGRHLKTYHPRPGTSSKWFHNKPWLDFNMHQTGTKWDRDNYAWILADYGKTPPKPVLDGEARYENSHMHFGNKTGPIVTAHQVRKAAYNAVLSGAMGHTYGCRDTWSFHVPGESTWRDVRTHWKQAMDFPGAFHMGVMKDLMCSRRWENLVPDLDRTVVTAGSFDGGIYVPAARAADGTFAYIYVPELQTIQVDMRKVGGAAANASWFDPRTGKTTPIGRFPTSDIRSFTTPGGDSDPDYVLVLEAAPAGRSA